MRMGSNQQNCGSNVGCYEPRWTENATDASRNCCAPQSLFLRYARCELVKWAIQGNSEWEAKALKSLALIDGND